MHVTVLAVPSCPHLGLLEERLAQVLQGRPGVTVTCQMIAERTRRSAAGCAARRRSRDQYAALLPVHERVLGAEHKGTLATRANLARWTGEAGDAAGARDQYAALLPVQERVLGAEHPRNLTARANLAYFTGEAGDAAGARDQYAALLPVHERVFGAESTRKP